MLVHQLINQAKDEQVAFYGKKQITYAEVRRQVSRYRNFFYQQGVRLGDNVGLLARNSVEYVYSYMAIASLGAVVVPLNFQLVPREIAYIIKDAGIRVLVSMAQLDLETELKAQGYEHNVNQLVIPEFSALVDAMELKPAPLLENFGPDKACVIIYTSGTTGNPKGAVLTHNNLVSNAAGVSEVMAVTAEDRVLCVLPMYHCFAWTCAILSPLLSGASILILEGFNPKETISTIREAGITAIYAVPPMYHLFCAAGQAEDFAKTRFFLSGGASLPEAVSRKFQAKFGRPVIEGYGLSEASPVVCMNRFDKFKYLSIGKAIPGVTAKIVDEEGREMPNGEIGELVVKGPNVMLGYFNLPEESARALRDGWLHTGDMAYRDDEGFYFIVDRLKDMIITSGENVYPREIEELLYAHPDISEAAVVGVPDKLRGQSGCAYIVMAEGRTFDKKALREYLQAKLAGYKIPRDFVQISALPKNSTGKILKRALREHAS